MLSAALLLACSLPYTSSSDDSPATAPQLEHDVVVALYSGDQKSSLAAIEAYRSHLTAQMAEVTLTEGLQAIFELKEEPSSLYGLMSLWLDSFGHVDAFYRVSQRSPAQLDFQGVSERVCVRLQAQEGVMLARIAQHERSSGEPAEEGFFHRFSEEPVFRFFHPSLMFPADPAALALARGVNDELTEVLLGVGDSAVGYIPELLQAMHPPGKPTMNTCRHVKRLVLLLDQLQQDGAISRAGGWGSLRVAEIGGGNGNMARLVGAASTLGFASWTIFDFPIMSRLQRWYLRETLGGVSAHAIPTTTCVSRVAERLLVCLRLPWRGGTMWLRTWSPGRVVRPPPWLPSPHTHARTHSHTHTPQLDFKGCV